jgi:hypothetical protein
MKIETRLRSGPGFNGFNDFSCQAPVSIPLWAAIRGLVAGYRHLGRAGLDGWMRGRGSAGYTRIDAPPHFDPSSTKRPPLLWRVRRRGSEVPAPESWSRLRGWCVRCRHALPHFDPSWRQRGSLRGLCRLETSEYIRLCNVSLRVHDSAERSAVTTRATRRSRRGTLRATQHQTSCDEVRCDSRLQLADGHLGAVR